MFAQGSQHPAHAGASGAVGGRGMNVGQSSIEDAVFEEVKEETRERVTYEVWTVAHKDAAAQPAITGIYDLEEALRLMHRLGGPALFEVRDGPNPNAAANGAVNKYPRATKWLRCLAKIYIWCAALIGGHIVFRILFHVLSDITGLNVEDPEKAFIVVSLLLTLWLCWKVEWSQSNG